MNNYKYELWITGQSLPFEVQYIKSFGYGSIADMLLRKDKINYRFQIANRNHWDNYYDKGYWTEGYIVPVGSKRSGVLDCKVKRTKIE